MNVLKRDLVHSDSVLWFSVVVILLSCGYIEGDVFSVLPKVGEGPLTRKKTLHIYRRLPVGLWAVACVSLGPNHHSKLCVLSIEDRRGILVSVQVFEVFIIMKLKPFIGDEIIFILNIMWNNVNFPHLKAMKQMKRMFYCVYTHRIQYST